MSALLLTKVSSSDPKSLELAQTLHAWTGRHTGPGVGHLEWELSTLETPTLHGTLSREWDAWRWLTLSPQQAAWHLSQLTRTLIVPVVSPAHRPPLPLPRAALPAPGRHNGDVVVNVRLLSAHPQPLALLSAAQGPALSACAPGPGVSVNNDSIFFYSLVGDIPVSPQQTHAKIQCHQQ